jgi:cell division protease FtsH
MLELEEAIDRVISGPERKTRVMDDEERKLIAYHETGHALVGYALPNSDPVHKVTIVARGRSLGHTLALPTHDKYLVRRSELVDQLAMLLGGRTAEEIIFADPTTGAANDIEKATAIARKMVMEYGMSDILGPMQYGKPNGEVFLGRDYSRQQDYSDEVAANIDNEVRKMINAAHEEARLILETHADAMQRMVDKLMDKETVDRQEVAELFSDVPKWEHTSEGAMRLRYPENPVIPQPRDEPIAAAEEAETEDEPVTESLTLNRKLRRSTRPATDAGA